MGTRIISGRYRLRRELGRGGMAEVWLADDGKHHRDVALKVLRPDLAALVGPDRFLREIAITAALNHPHILPLLDSGVDGQVLFYVMPYAPGGSLRVLLRAGSVPLEAVTRIVREVAAALDHAHARGIIHRDIKPENILFTEGLAVVSDFGIARVLGEARAGLTGTGLSVGTLGYMSPEQALGTAELDAKSDVYALGCVLYELLVGATPAAWPGAEDVALGRFADLPSAHRARLDALPGRVEQVLVRALALRPQHRYATPGELAAALAAACERTPQFTEEQVRELLRRAAELQVAEPEPAAGGALTIGAVEQIAAQVGIPPAHVRRAANELQAAPASSARTRWERIALERVLDVEVPGDVFPEMAAEIERRLDIVGHASIVGSTLTWSPAAQGEESRKIVVQVAAVDGHTSIRIREDLGLQGIRRVAPALGALMGGAVGAAWSQALGLADAGALLLLVPLGAVGIALAIRTMFWVDHTGRAPKLGQLADALADLGRRAIAGSLTASGPRLARPLEGPWP